MPYSGGTFTYTSPGGATGALAGQIIQSSVWNQIHTDILNALTQSYSQLIAQIPFRNILCANGGFEVWQRGAGASSSIAVAAAVTAYTADRIYIATNANQASVVSAQAGLSNGSRLSGRFQRNAAQTGTGIITVGYPLTTDEVIRLRGARLSLAFLAQTGANWSPASGTFTVNFYTGTGTEGRRGASFTGETTVLTIATNLAAGSAVTSISGTSASAVPTNVTQGELQFVWTPVGTAGAADSIQFDDIELESMLSASTWAPMNFERLLFDTELYLCKRHYQKTFDYNIAASQGASFLGALAAVGVTASNAQGVNWNFPVEMRTTPSLTTYSPGGASANWVAQDAATSVTVVTSASAGLSSKNAFIYHQASTSGTGQTTRIYIQAAVSAGL